MAKINYVEAPRGLDDLKDMLAFLADTKAAQDYVDKLQAMLDQCNAAVALVGSADEIQGMNIRAAQSEKDAAARLDAAKAAAVKIVADAQAAKDAVAAEIVSSRADLAAEIRAAMAAADRRSADLDTREHDLGDREEAAKKLQLDAAALMEQAQALVAEYTAKAERLKNAIG